MTSQLQKLILNIVSSNNNNHANNNVKNNFKDKRIKCQKKTSVAQIPLPNKQVESEVECSSTIDNTRLPPPRKVRRVVRSEASALNQNPSISCIFQLLIDYYNSANRDIDFVKSLYYPTVRSNQLLFDYYKNNNKPVKNIIIVDKLDDYFTNLKKLFNHNNTIIIVLNFYPVYYSQKKNTKSKNALIQDDYLIYQRYALNIEENNLDIFESQKKKLPNPFKLQFHRILRDICMQYNIKEVAQCINIEDITYSAMRYEKRTVTQIINNLLKK